VVRREKGAPKNGPALQLCDNERERCTKERGCTTALWQGERKVHQRTGLHYSFLVRREKVAPKNGPELQLCGKERERCTKERA